MAAAADNHRRTRHVNFDAGVRADGGESSRRTAHADVASDIQANVSIEGKSGTAAQVDAGRDIIAAGERPRVGNVAER